MRLKPAAQVRHPYRRRFKCYFAAWQGFAPTIQAKPKRRPHQQTELPQIIATVTLECFEHSNSQFYPLILNALSTQDSLMSDDNTGFSAVAPPTSRANRLSGFI